MHFEQGDVLSVAWDDRPIRVLMGDEIEAFYDAFLPEVGWNLSRARTAIYYRVQTSFLRSSAELIRKEPLTDQERAVHRPDLPMRLFQCGDADWAKPRSAWPRLNCDFAVDAAELAIIPFGPKGAPLKAARVEAANGQSISATELLEKANALQIARCPEVQGVGLFRSGISSGIPSYYIWGAVDKAGHSRPQSSSSS
jgi:hypothetical protein